MKEPKTFIERIELNRLIIELENLFIEIEKQLPLEKKFQFGDRVNLTLRQFGINIINGVAKDAKECSNGEWIEIKPIVQKRLDRVETLMRRQDLKYPSNPENFEATLRWMVEQGEEEDLDLIRKVKKTLPYSSTEISQLLKIAEQRISKRVDYPNYVVKKGEKEYQQGQEEWDKKSARQYIPLTLLQKLERLQGNLNQVRKFLEDRWGIFSTHIHNAQQDVESENAENAFQTLENLFDELQELSAFFVTARATRTRGGLLSAYEQTPVKMNESLVRQRDVPDPLDSERLTEILYTLVNEIQMIDESSGSGQ
jgi:hypothetical protein